MCKGQKDKISSFSSMIHNSHTFYQEQVTVSEANNYTSNDLIILNCLILHKKIFNK